MDTQLDSLSYIDHQLKYLYHCIAQWLINWFNIQPYFTRIGRDGKFKLCVLCTTTNSISISENMCTLLAVYYYAPDLSVSFEPFFVDFASIFDMLALLAVLISPLLFVVCLCCFLTCDSDILWIESIIASVSCHYLINSSVVSIALLHPGIDCFGFSIPCHHHRRILFFYLPSVQCWKFSSPSSSERRENVWLA